MSDIVLPKEAAATAVVVGKTEKPIFTPIHGEGRTITSKRLLVRNRARCTKCDTTIESKARHDFVQCRCGAIFVDGGLAYLRRGGDLNAIEELSAWQID